MGKSGGAESGGLGLVGNLERRNAFQTYIALHFGLASPACRSIVGQEIRRGANTSFHTVVDPEGLNLLTAANGPGALRTQKHDIIQGTLVEEAARAGVQAWTNQVINTETAIRVSNWQGSGLAPSPSSSNEEDESRLTRIRPDIQWTFRSRRGMPFRYQSGCPTQGTTRLSDVKIVGYLDSSYVRRNLTRVVADQNAESLAVRRRSNKVNTEYLNSARKRDEEFLGIAPRQQQNQSGGSRGARQSGSNGVVDGPFRRTIRSYGKVLGLVCGAFGELSSEFDELIGHMAHEQAKETKAKSGTLMMVNQIADTHRRRLVQRLGTTASLGIVDMMLQIGGEASSGQGSLRKPRRLRNLERDIQKALERQQPRYYQGMVASSRDMN